MPAIWDRTAPAKDFWCQESSMCGISVQSGLCSGGEQKLMLCVVHESESEYSMERGLPLAEAFEWISPPATVSSDVVAPSEEVRHERRLSLEMLISSL